MRLEMRLDKLLSNLGYGSRKEMTALAKAGRITRASALWTDASRPISLDEVRNGIFALDGEALDPPSPLTLMLHKPRGYSCSHDEKGALIYDLLPPRFRRRSPALSAAGRLDKESTGQVILTDDGALLHRIIHPKYHAPKQYQVTLRGPVRGDEAALFATGGFLMQGDVKPLKPALWQSENEREGCMTLQEGRYHQIRRMFATLGNEVVALHRFHTGGLGLLGLEKGRYRLLGAEEIAQLGVRLAL